MTKKKSPRTNSGGDSGSDSDNDSAIGAHRVFGIDYTGSGSDNDTENSRRGSAPYEGSTSDDQYHPPEITTAQVVDEAAEESALANRVRDEVRRELNAVTVLEAVPLDKSHKQEPKQSKRRLLFSLITLFAIIAVVVGSILGTTRKTQTGPDETENEADISDDGKEGGSVVLKPDFSNMTARQCASFDNDDALSEAIEQANGNEILLCSTEIILSKQVVPSVPVKLVCEPNKVCILDAKNSSRHFYFGDEHIEYKVHFRGITFRNGYTQPSDGGSMRLVGVPTSDATFENCTFSDNYSGENGGAISIVGGTLQLIGCSFISNTGYTGGAISAMGGYGTTTLILEDSEFINNTAQGHVEGGAISINGAFICKGDSNVFSGNVEPALVTDQGTSDGCLPPATPNPTQPSCPDTESTLSRIKSMGLDIRGAESFGQAVSLSETGQRVAIGGPRAGTSFNGAQVHGFNHETGQWEQIGNDFPQGPGVGSSVSLNEDGSRIAVSASRMSGNGLSFNGAVQIYQVGESITTLGDAIWGEASKEQIGEWDEALSLSKDGKTVAIGIKANDSVRIYQFDEDSLEWNKTFDVKMNSGGNFGFAVSLGCGGNCLAASSPSHPLSADRNVGPGQVTTFVKGIDDWYQIEQVLLGEEDGDEFGSSVSFSENGNILAVGSEGFQKGRGQVKVYQLTDAEDGKREWVQLGPAIVGFITNERGENLGTSVSLSNDGIRLAVGTRKCANEQFGNIDGGGLRVFEYMGWSWCEVGDAVCGFAAFDNLGSSVAMSGNGNVVAAGAVGYGLGQGYVRTFTIT